MHINARVRRVQSDPEHIMTGKTIRHSRGITDELINHLVKSTGMLVDVVRALAARYVIVLKVEFKKSGELCKSDENLSC